MAKTGWTIRSLALAGAILAGPAWAQPAAPASSASAAGSLSGGATSEATCARLRKEYLDSQACFERYRIVGGAVKPEAFERCRNVVDPSPRCGPDLPTK